MIEEVPRLNLATLLATRAFAQEDLSHNRRGALSPSQDEWRRAHPVFMDDDEPAIETIVGRVAIEGRYLAQPMGVTSFAQLVVGGRRLALRPGLKRALVRDAPFRAYAAYGWIWSIEPASEEELLASAMPVTAYRTAPRTHDAERVGRELQAALCAELGFNEDDVAANREGAFSKRQRRAGRAMAMSALVRWAMATVMVAGFGALQRTLVLTSFLFVFAVMLLIAWWGTSLWALVDALGQVMPRRPLRLIASLERDPIHRDDVLLDAGAQRFRIKRAAVAIRAAAFAEVSSWRFEVCFVPWTRRVLTVRPVSPLSARG